MDKSIKALIITCVCAWLFGSCIITKLKAEDVVTGNILPNAGNSVVLTIAVQLLSYQTIHPTLHSATMQPLMVLQ